MTVLRHSPSVGNALHALTIGLSHAIERHAIAVLVVYSLLLFRVTGLNAVAKPFWHDEVYTMAMADQPTLGALWQSEMEGLDSAPPLNAIATRVVHQTLGGGPITTRLPGLLGFWIASLLVFRIVRARSSAVAGLCGVLILFFSGGLPYAFEARPYGLMLGLFAGTLLAWSEAAAGRYRRVWLPILAILMAASLWNHYFAALTFLPLAAGEAVRAVRRSRIDWGVASAFALAVLALLPLAPHLRIVGDSAATYFHRASLDDLPLVVKVPLGLLTLRRFMLVYVAVGVVMLAGASAFFRFQAPSLTPLPRHEVVAALVGIAIPVIGWLVGVFVTGVFLPRYGLSAVVALAVAMALIVARSPRFGGAAALLLTAGLSTGFAFHVYLAETSSRPGFLNPLDSRPLLTADLRGTRPVVVSNFRYLNLWYYLTPEQRRSLTCIVNPAAAVRFTGGDSVDRDYLVLRKWLPVEVRDYRTFTRSVREFRLYSDPSTDWITAQLRRDGARLTRVGSEGAFDIYDVSTAGLTLGDRRP